MTPSQKLQLKLNQLEAEKMTVEMKITGERAKVTRLEELEAIRKELEFDIVATRNQILAERKLEEKEQSAAEKWVNKYCGYELRQDLAEKDHFDYWNMRHSHEAGQKHGTEVELERVKPLVDAIKILGSTECRINIDELGRRVSDLLKILKNYQRGWTITGPDLELPEKPSWADDPEPKKNYKKIKDGIFAYLENAKGGHLDYKQRDTAMIVFETLRHLHLI